MKIKYNSFGIVLIDFVGEIHGYLKNEDSGEIIEIEDMVKKDDELVRGQGSSVEFIIDIKSDCKSYEEQSLHEYFDIPKFVYNAEEHTVPTIRYTKSGIKH